MSDKRAAYIGIRHLSPDCIRLMRAALDNGVSVDELRKGIKKQKGPMSIIEDTLDALDYLVSNPQAGVVRWIDGHSYDFIDR